jgi:hypothetical protein
MATKLRIWVEGLVIVSLSCLGLIEAVRLIIYKDPNTLYDPLGPGWYIFIVAAGALLAGISHIIANLIHLPPRAEQDHASPAMNSRLPSTIAVAILYVILLHYLGFFISSLVFLILSFRIMGNRSWAANIVLGVAVSGICWLVFVKYSDILFPGTILF